MNKLVALGMGLVMLGVLGLAVAYFTTQHTEDVARLGNMNLQTTRTQEHTIPPMLAGCVLVIGLLLSGVGLARRT